MDAAATFRRGVEHWNARRFFEAHEDWEEVWGDAEDPQRLWLQGLIQLAAAFVHFERGFHATGFVKLIRGGREKVRGYSGATLGLRFDLLWRDMLPWFDHAEAVASGRGLADGAPPLPTLSLDVGAAQP